MPLDFNLNEVKTVPICLIVDDGAPVNMYFFHRLSEKHELLIPPAFTYEFAKTCDRAGIKGKFSVMPMPACLGRIDQSLNLVPDQALREFIQIAREHIAPRFSITPEILTHFIAYNLETGGRHSVMEDVYIGSAGAEEISRYVGLALEILRNAGFDPEGVTSPWNTGIDNEDNYAEGIGRAFKNTLGKDSCFYFLHSADGPYRKPRLMRDSPETGRVVSVPSSIGDLSLFWDSQNPASWKEAERKVSRNIDSALSADGRTGRLRELFEAGLPMVMTTHWQSLYSDGRGIGLAGLETLAHRVNSVFGPRAEWVTMRELAAACH